MNIIGWLTTKVQALKAPGRKIRPATGPQTRHDRTPSVLERCAGPEFASGVATETQTYRILAAGADMHDIDPVEYPAPYEVYDGGVFLCDATADYDLLLGRLRMWSINPALCPSRLIDGWDWLVIVNDRGITMDRRAIRRQAVRA